MLYEKIHHIGIAVNNMEESKFKYMSKGYEVICSGYDDVQLSWICLLHKQNQETLELVNSDNQKSPVFNMCRNNKEKIYHTCFEVVSMDTAINNLRDRGFLKVSNISYANVLGGNVCFLYSKRKNLIELLEVKNGKNFCI